MEDDRPENDVVYKDTTREGHKMLASHFLTRIGDKMWEFIIPLVIIEITPNTLLPAAMYGLVQTLSRVLFGPSLGRRIDRSGRLSLVEWAIFIQLMTVAASGGCLYFLLYFRSPSWSDNIFVDWIPTLLFVGLMVSCGCSSLATMALDISVQKDWVPTVVKRDGDLSTMNTRMTQVDLISEVAGPFIAGALLLIPNVTLTWAFVGIAGFNYITFGPEYALLRSVFHNVSDLRKIKKIPEDTNDAKTGCSAWFWSEWNPVASIITGWNTYYAQPVFLVSISFVLLWFTILSPHDVVFTAYLKTAGYEEYQLAIFRGVGALVGALATFAFPFLSARIGVQRTAFIYIAEEALMVLFAGCIFTVLYLNILAPDMQTYFQIIFLIFITLSRCGLYGFEIGEVQILQQGIPVLQRGEVNSVEGSLTSMSTLLVNVCGIFVSNPQYFIGLVWASVFFVGLGSVVYFVWRLRWSIEFDEHTHGEGDVEHNLHIGVHLEIHEEELQRRGQHAHAHFHRIGKYDYMEEEGPLLEERRYAKY